jgi:hypothetical protein
VFKFGFNEIGTDTIADFNKSQGDKIDLSGMLQGSGITSANVANFLSLSQSGSTTDAVLNIDPAGTANFTNPQQTIIFTGAWVAGNLQGVTATELHNQRVIYAGLDVSGNANATPLVLDLNGDGVRTTSVAKGVWFDVAANGQPALTGWADSHDGLLALDLNGDGQINNGAELFGSGTETANGKAHDGYAALAQYDLNSDGVIDTQDTVFANLQVWVDGNLDGLTQAGELHSLASLGIASMGLQSLAGTQVDNGNTLGLTSSWTGADGLQHAMADVFFASTSLQDLVQQATAKVDLDADPAANVQNVHLADVLATDQKLMVIKAGTNDVVNIDPTGWSNADTTTTVDNHTYVLWNNGAAHLLIDQNALLHQVL